MTLWPPRIRASAGLYGLLTVAVFGSAWMAQRFTQPDEPLEPKGKGPVDYYSVNFLRTIVDVTGKVKNVLYAERFTHYQVDDHAELEKPVLTIYSGDGPPWVVHGERGTVSSHGTEVILSGPVLVLRDVDRNGRTVRAETSNVKILPDEQYGETEDFVQIFSYPDELSGVGMQVSFADGLKVKVLSSVRRRHDVQRVSAPAPGKRSAPVKPVRRKR